jgi:hypothetical protein
MDTTSFIGLTKSGAIDKAEKNNLIFRLIRIDDRSFFSYPEKKNLSRICVEIDNGKVSKAIVQ